MTDLEILEILERKCGNLEKAMAFRAAFDNQKPSALKVQPIKERKARGPNKPKPILLGHNHLMNGHDEVQS